MVKKTLQPCKHPLERKNLMTIMIQTDRNDNMASHKPTLKDLIFDPSAFYGFSANAQLAHLALPDTQTDHSQSQKSQFLTDPRLRTITF